MTWVDILVLAVLFFSFIGGLKDGAIKSLFSVLALILAVPFAGISYYLVATVLAVLPGTDWENFIGFFVTLGAIVLILHLVLLTPRKLAETVWDEGMSFRLFGGAMGLLRAGISLVLFVLVVGAYPIVGWLEQLAADSTLLGWLVAHLDFVAAMLPDIFSKATALPVAF